MDTSKASDHELLQEHGQPNHVVQFYEDHEFLHETVARFLGRGLVAGEPVVAILTRENREALSARLVSKGFDVERARSTGLLALFDAEETLSTFMVGEVPDRERFESRITGVLDGAAGAEGPRRLRVYGEMVDVLWRNGNRQAAHRLEEYWNGLVRLHGFHLLCAYSMGNFFKEADREPFEEVCKAHTHVSPAESYSDAPDHDTRLREISRLQQRACALETELARRNEMEDALRGAREEAEAAVVAKDEFLAMLGHELRNPLSPILTALELMKLRSDGRSTREQDVIDRQARHLIRLVDDLLDVSRIARGKVELRKQIVEMREVLAKAMEMASPLLEQRRHHFEVVAPPPGLRLRADEARLAQVVANLLTNSAKYTEPGGHISLLAWRDGEEAVIEVRDDGMGIAHDLLPRVFDLFVQGRQSTERPSGGLGLGLSIVRNLVTMHGGTVQARSGGPGLGSTFTVRLPAVDRESRPPDVGRSLVAAPSSEGRRRILVVDDNEDALAMLKEILSASGHEVEATASAPAALEIAVTFQPEIAIVDIGLPVMDGYELATRLRADHGARAPWLIALTGYGQSSDRERSRAAGFAVHLVKPLEIVELLDTIQSVPSRAAQWRVPGQRDRAP